MLIITCIRGLKVVDGLMTDEKIEAFVKFNCNVANDPKGVYLSYPWLFLQHEIGHMCPVPIQEAI